MLTFAFFVVMIAALLGGVGYAVANEGVPPQPR
jgi:hypothetical protein